jgi:Tol biopolymer transport system component/DNA-binding winged helix-turn-helix (wHTH) protein
MQVPANGSRRLGFGLFQVDLAARQLHRRGALVHLQDQPFEILSMLLEHPGEIVTREELRSRLWPADTFVDFDEGLNTAIKKLRHALGDSPDNPTFIETVPRRGYRFIAPPKTLQDPSDHSEQGNGCDPEDRSPFLTNGSIGSKLSGSAAESPATTKRIIGTVPGSSFNLKPNHASIAEPLTLRPSKQPWWTSWVLLAGGLVLIFLLDASYMRRARAPQRSMHFSVALPVAMRDLALSHDGHILAFAAPQAKDGGIALWALEVGTSGARPLENTEGASYPFWSPDDRFIAFFADGKLKKIAAAGGPVQLICEAPIGRGGTWNRDGVIVFAGDPGVALRRVSAAGGNVTMVPGFEQKVATTMSNRWPVFLPDGNHFLYTSVDFGADLRGDSNAIYVAQLDSAQRRRLVTSNGNAVYLPGYLLFLRNGTLMAQRFDAGRLELTGEAFAVANEVEYLSSVARGLFSVSETGTLIYQRESGATFSQLVWFDREGKRVGTLGAPARYANPRLSPDGKRVAVDIDDPESSNTDIWVIEARRQVPSRFTFDPGQDETPLWAHDGRRILWLSDRGGKNGFYLKAGDGSAIGESLTMPVGVDLSFASAPSDWSFDGRFLLYTDLQEGTALHLWVLPMIGDAKPYRFLSGTSADVEGQFSPDGHWVAYSSNESGRWQVYVAPFPGQGDKYQISTEGGQQPRWRRDGKELFFLSRDRRLVAVPVKTGSAFDFGAPATLFETHAHEPLTAEEFFTYDLSADGRRFLINANAEQNEPRPVDIILNWSSQLKK